MAAFDHVLSVSEEIRAVRLRISDCERRSRDPGAVRAKGGRLESRPADPPFTFTCLYDGREDGMSSTLVDIY
jgi:hypothetical protein